MVPLSPSRRPAGRRTPRINRPSVLALEGRTLLTASPRLDTFAVPTLQAFPEQLVNGPDGDLWFNESSGSIGRITPQGQITEIQLQTPSGGLNPPTLSAMTAGPDGNLWAIDSANNTIDRIGQDGQVATFPIPANQRGGDTGSIVSGADGNLWFTTGLNPGGWDPTQEIPNGVPGTIDRITPEGDVTPFALPVGGGVATSLAVGPDGIWFTDPDASRVGEIDYSGHAVEYTEPAPYFDTTATPLVVGPDGDAYYYAQGNNSSSFIVKVAPGGAIAPIDVPGSIQSISDMVSGPDGIYFLVQPSNNDGSNDVSDSLDRLNPDETLSTISTNSALSSASGFAFGADGNLWFTAGPFSPVIGRLDVSPTPVPVPGPALVGAASPNQSLIEPVGDATTFQLAGVRSSPGVTVDSATVDWGDGSTPTAGTYAALSVGTLDTAFVDGQVSGSHAYAKAGSYTVTVTIDGTGPTGAAMTTSVVDTATAVDPSVSPQPPLGLQANKSIAYQGPLAVFSTPVGVSGSGFTATVDWGDGSTPTAGTVAGGYESALPPTPTSFEPDSGVPATHFEVSGDHTYATAGTFTVTVTLTDQLGHSSTESTSILVEPGPLVLDPPSPILVTADPTADSSIPGQDSINLGTLTDYLGTLVGWTDSVTVDWGDGSTPITGSFSPSNLADNPPLGGTPAILSFFPSQIDGNTAPGAVADEIQGTHAYAQAGAYTVKISADDNQGDSTEATATVQVSAAELTVSPLQNSPGGTAGEPISDQPLVTIEAPDLTDPASDFTATVDWGDGSTPTTGTVAAIAETQVTTATSVLNSNLQVSGDHTYAKPGLYPVTVTVDGPDGSTAKGTTIAFVSPASDVSGSSPGTPSFTAGAASAPTVLGSFNSANDSTAADFKATVDWGDGSPIQSATIQPATPPQSGSNEFNVLGGHDYAQAGAYTVTLTVTDGVDLLPDVITSQATVATPANVTVTPPPTPVVVTNLPPTMTTPAPIASPTPKSTTTPTPMVCPSDSIVAMGPIAPTILPRHFPDFEPTIVKLSKPALKDAELSTKTAKAKPKVVHHVAKKPAHAALAKKHPAGPARLV
jgi:streptogramin lyase